MTCEKCSGKKKGKGKGNASTPVLSFDLHFQINSLGSTDELTK